MAYFLDIPFFKDPTGTLSVLDEIVPYDIKRVYFISTPSGIRGGHRHSKTIQSLVCVAGKCEIYINNGQIEKVYQLDSKDKLLIIDPSDWRTMQKFSSDCVLLVISSERYLPNEYIKDSYI